MARAFKSLGQNEFAKFGDGQPVGLRVVLDFQLTGTFEQGLCVELLLSAFSGRGGSLLRSCDGELVAADLRSVH